MASVSSTFSSTIFILNRTLARAPTLPAHVLLACEKWHHHQPQHNNLSLSLLTTLFPPPRTFVGVAQLSIPVFLSLPLSPSLSSPLGIFDEQPLPRILFCARSPDSSFLLVRGSSFFPHLTIGARIYECSLSLFSLHPVTCEPKRGRPQRLPSSQGKIGLSDTS